MDAKNIMDKFKLLYEVFQTLPIPLIGVNSDQEIIMVNRAAQKLPVETIPLKVGKKAFEYLPDYITGRIAVSLRTNVNWSISKCALWGGYYRLECFPFSKHLCREGVLLILNPE
ncbi:hypothetical protein DENIS_1825 [Desulfonema ishimotonii]|uniref:PAS domain-containing protein n=2 Tax=Desulfonema ishimotonii TaxID=45657 RepID=A0A401FV75_9BACT|nr:hypothetical protein DENIS_1825 [Desulfonema ishimotonii]